MELIGKVLGNRYEILEKIGTGGMAIVYKARCKLLNRYVAVKVLKSEYTTDIEFVKRFKAEAQSAASLTHPNIVSVYDVGEELGINYIVMELLEGDTLKDLIEKKGKLGNELTLRYASQIASALETAHAAKIIHRDIKPQNIVLTGNNIAKVTDFGIAKMSTKDTISSNSSTIGSVHYFSPEHAKGGYTDEKSDIYSLGVVMYEMATGKLPFNADTPVTVALKQIQETPLEPREIEPSVSVGLNKIIMKAMEKSTTHRYQTAGEMLDDIFSAINNPVTYMSSHTKEEQGNNYNKIDGPWASDNQNNLSQDTTLGSRKNARHFANQNAQEDGMENKKSVTILLSIVLVVALIGLSILSIKLINTIKEQNNQTPIVEKITHAPALVGKSYELVKEEYLLKGLTISVQKYVKNAEYEAGLIVSQDVLEGQEIPNGKINVVVSNGPELITMIDVVGKDYTVAKYELEAMGFKVAKKDVIDEKIAVNTIIKQSVEKEKSVPTGTEVILEVSKGNGKTMVVVPNVVGDNEDVALTTLQDLKFMTKVEETTDATKADGVVLSQSLQTNQEVEQGSLIQITVNRLPKSATYTVKMQTLAASASSDSIQVKVTAMIDGKTSEVVNKAYSAPFKDFDVSLTGFDSAKVYVYFDNTLVSEETVNFN